MRLEGTVAVVTGGGRGIGLAIAEAQARAGAKVVVASRNKRDLDAAVAKIAATGGTAMAIAADLADVASVDALFHRVAASYGHVDVLINNAGSFVEIGPIWEADPDVWWRDVEVNIKSVFLCCRAVLPSMIERGAGRILNLIGGGTAGSFPGGPAYASSKTAVMRLTECVADTVCDKGISVFGVAPGLVRTDMTEYQLTSTRGKKYLPMIARRFAAGDHLPPERVADLAVDIAVGRFDALSGRALSAWDDLDEVEAHLDDILANDLRALRLTGFGPTLKPLD